jgi:biopolymer transport protein ExbB/TolQ
MFQNDSIWQMILRGGPTMALLIGCSILSWAVILERWWKFRHSGSGSDRLVARVCKLARAGQAAEALGLAQSEEGCVAQVLHAGLAQGTKSRNGMEEAMDRRAAELLMDLESRLSVLGTLGSTSPYIGLFGTVLGIIRAFQALAVSTQAGVNAVSAGIAEALICTAAGLAVAVPSVIAYNAFVRAATRLDTRMALASSELSGAVFEKGGRGDKDAEA